MQETQKKSSFFFVLVLLSSINYTHKLNATQLDITLSPMPQAFSNTCQSYSLAFALATERGSRYSIENASELRGLELDIRTMIDQIAAEKHTTPYDHDVWRLATERYTHYRFTLQRENSSDIVQFLKRVGEITGIDNAAQLGPTFSTILMKRPVLTSVTQIAGNNYADGHILSIIGKEGSVNSNAKILALNSAVKVGANYKNSCQISDLPGDTKYTAVASLQSDFVLKAFGGNYRLMWIRPRLDFVPVELPLPASTSRIFVAGISEVFNESGTEKAWVGGQVQTNNAGNIRYAPIRWKITLEGKAITVSNFEVGSESSKEVSVNVVLPNGDLAGAVVTQPGKIVPAIFRNNLQSTILPFGERMGEIHGHRGNRFMGKIEQPTGAGNEWSFVWTDANGDFVFNQGELRRLKGLQQNSFSTAYDMNAQGRIVGSCDTTDAAGSTVHACIWNDEQASPTDLGALSGGSVSSATSINNSNGIVGWSDTGVAHSTHGVYFKDSDRTDTKCLGTNTCHAVSINDSALVVGWSKNTSGDDRATVWSPSYPDLIDLNEIPILYNRQTDWNLNTATSINNKNIVAGKGIRNGSIKAYVGLLELF